MPSTCSTFVVQSPTILWRLETVQNQIHIQSTQQPNGLGEKPFRLQVIMLQGTQGEWEGEGVSLPLYNIP